MKTQTPLTLPDQAAFTSALVNHNLVPVHRTIIADLDTPLALFAKIYEKSQHVFLFESMEGGEKWGRYSFMGFDPLLTFTSQGEDIHIGFPGHEEKQEERRKADPIETLRQLMQSFFVADLPDLPKFYGGAVGYLGYDMVRFVEKLPDRHAPNNIPDSSFFIPRIVLIHDQLRQRLTIVCNVWKQEQEDPAPLYADACKRIDAVIARLREPIPAECYQSRTTEPHSFVSNTEKLAFKEMVERAKEYILAGDIIQVVLSQRFQAKTSLQPFALYRALRHINPSPYLFFLHQKETTLIGSSPEILVRLVDGQIELRPIAGTRPRGRNPEQDQALEKELLADPKERAEHLMLVDLGRNDVGRVAAPGTVKVHDLLVIERYSHVMHIVSGVTGQLPANKDQFDVFSACFPAGTVSGAPKIRAMEIIDELEMARRGPYAGAVGYFGFSGNMDFCIAIRTYVLHDDSIWIQAGAGIVADSDPEKEHEETLNKAKALRRAVELAERGGES
jgi:anthranilate synthase component 1